MPLLTLTGSYILRPLDTGGAPRAPSIDQLRQWAVEIENAVDAAYRVGIIDELALEGDLPVSGTNGDAYVIDGDLWVWLSGAADWFNAGPISAGATGSTGSTGPTGSTAFDFSTTTADADPGSGYLRLNHATPASATAAFIDNNNRAGQAVSAWLDTLDDAGASTDRGLLHLMLASDPQNHFHLYRVTGSIVDGTGYRKATLEYVAGAGSFSNDAELLVAFFPRGPTGAPGAGTGDVVGPASSADNAIARYHSTTGKEIQNSANAILSDNGDLAIGADALAADVSHVINTAAGQSRLWGGRTGGLLRWLWGVNQTAEGGADAGSDYAIARYADSGSFIDVCVTIARATGYATFIRLSEGANRVLSVVGGLTLTGGFAATPIDDGTKSSGTFTPTCVGGNMRRYVNGGAHTLAPPTDEGTMVIQITNNGSAGAITTSGFTKVSGDAFTTTDGHDFMCYISRINGFSHLTVVALQ